MSDESATVTEMPRKSARDRILAHPRAKREQLEIPEWEVTVELRSMSIAQKGEVMPDDLEGLTPKRGLEMLCDVVVFTCCDPETHEPIFTAEDLNWLKSEPASIVELVGNKGLEVSGLNEQAGDEGKGDS